MPRKFFQLNQSLATTLRSLWIEGGLCRCIPAFAFSKRAQRFLSVHPGSQRNFCTLALFRLFGGVLFALTLAGFAQSAILDQPMTGATAPGWVLGGSAYLSASTGVDMPGNGWLRLTEPVGNQSGFAMYDSSFDISQGVVIQFDYATWGGNGADGYSVYLFDGMYNAATFSAGASGGSLGYAQKVGTGATDDPGLTGGYLGIGIDEYGGFTATACRQQVNCPGL